MHRQMRARDAVHWFVDEMTSRIVAESGIPSDRFHLGKMILQGLKDDLDFVGVIDGATKRSETNRSTLERTVRCATAIRKFGLQCGDVIVLMAPNHLELGITLNAALCLGVAIAAVDKELSVREMASTFETDKPKMVFCQNSKLSDVQQALKSQGLDAQIITYDGEGPFSYANFLEKYSDNTPVDEFKATDFDPEQTIAFLVSTSGTTGLPKASVTTHKNLAIAGPYTWNTHSNFPTPIRMNLIVTQLQWISVISNFVMSPIMKYTRLQTSAPITPDHIFYLINTYKPTSTMFGPTLFANLLEAENRQKCDFSCFEQIKLGGSPLSAELAKRIKNVAVNAVVCDVYGMSEINILGFYIDSPPPGSCGKPMPCLEYRLIDVITGEDITETNKPGELWVKGPSISKGYYNNPKATEEAFAEDQWFKTGDIFHRDENWNFFFADRLKLLLKYQNIHISPIEVEEVIRHHPGVQDVAVTGIPDPFSGELVVACVVRRPGHNVTAQEIKELVKSTLTESKQLRGGVIFLDSLPITSTMKVHRRKLKELVLHLERE